MDPQSLKDKASAFFPDLQVNTVPGAPGETEVSFDFLPSSKTDDKVSKIIIELEKQVSELMGSFTGDLSKEQRADKSQKIKEIQDAIEALKESGSIAMIPEIAAQQLKWVQTTIDKDHPTANDLMTSWRIVELWSNSISLLYGADSTGTVGEAPKELKDVASLAINLADKLNAEKMRKVLNEISQSKKLVGPEFEGKLTDIGTFSAYALSVNRAESLLTQEVALIMQNTARERDKEGVGLVNRLTKLQKIMEDVAGKKGTALNALYSEFIQENESGNAWGIVGRFSQDWFDFRRDARETRVAAVKKIRANPTLAPGELAKEKQIKKAWEAYWKKINAAAIMIDTTKFFDPITGDVIKGPHYDELVRELGEDLAKEQLTKAQVRYREYLEHKEAAFTDIEAKRLAGEYTEEDELKHKNDFIETHSPDLFFKNKNGISFTQNNRGEWYTVMVPKASQTKFYDSKFKGIMESPQKAAIYNELRDILESHRKMLPLGVQRDLGSNFLPVVQNRLIGDIMNTKEWWSTLNQAAIDALTATEFEIAHQGTDRIPIRFVNKDKLKDQTGRLKTEELSHDLPRIIELFGLMAIHYKHFARAKDAIDMGHAVVKYIDMQRRAGVVAGEALGNTLAAIE